MTNPFKKLFEGKKNQKIRQDLIVSIDDRKTGDPEVLCLRTTSFDNITLTAKSEKISVHPDDLQEALNSVKTFIEARPAQPKTQTPLGTKHISAMEETENKTKQQEEAIKKKNDFDLKD